MRLVLKTAVAAVLAVAMLTLPGVARARRASPRANLLLITLDTTRADHLGCYGYKLAATPALDRLARDGVRFADATSQAPLTAPAHAALFTGVYPARDGLRENGGTGVPTDRPTLAEVLRRSGYRTAAFISAFVLDRAYGFAQGFDVFDSGLDGRSADGRTNVSRTAGEVLQAALPWLARAPSGSPFFAWVHFYDAHAPYTPPEPYRTAFRSNAYDGEIAYVDSAVGKLLAALERNGALDNTLVVAIGDHGESLGEHGEAQHGLFLYDSVLHVPWLMRLPGRDRAGFVVNEQVRSVDLLPTVLELLGVRAPAAVDGASVVGPMRGHPRNDVPPAYAETFYGKFLHGWSEVHALRVGEWKVIDASKPELYQLRKDPREATNRVQDRQAVAGRMAADLREMIGELGSRAVAQARPRDAGTSERLRSLGYISSGGGGASSATGREPRPDRKPAQAASFSTLFEAAAAAMYDKRVDLAIMNLKRALVIDGRSYEAHLLLGRAYDRVRQFDAALGEYDTAALLQPKNAEPLIASAAVFAALGNTAVASDRLRRAEALAPGSHEVPLQRGIIAEKQGRLAEAFVLYQEAVAANAADPEATARFAQAAARLRRWDIAAPMFAALRDIGWQPSRTHFGLGQVAEARGDAAAAAREYARALELDPALEAARTGLARLRTR